MNEQELKALQLEIKNEQNKQSDAIAEMKKDVGAQNTALLEKYDAAAANIQKLSEQADAIQLAQKDMKMGSQKTSPFDDMKKSLTDRKVLDEFKSGGQRTFELKVSTIDRATELSDSSLLTTVLHSEYEPGISAAPDLMPSLLTLIARGPINAARTSWVERSARTDGMATNASAAVAEGTQYPQSDFTWIRKYAAVEKIGTFIKVTNEVLEDWDQALDAIRSELFPMVERALERAVYDGTGVSPQMQGIVDTGIASAFTLASITGIVTPNHFDAFRTVRAQLAVANFTGPFDVMVNPIDGALLDLPKNADGIYLLPPFTTSDRRTIGGMRIIESNLIPAGYFLAGDFKRDKLFIKRAIEVKIWDQDSTDPEYDLKTITASVRAVNRIKTPDYNAFVFDEIGDVLTAIG